MGDVYYRWFPGDYMRDTSDLSMVEDCAYRRLLDHYYSEGRLPSNNPRLYRICRATSPEEQRAVDFIVDRFFTVEGDRLCNARAEKELEERREFLAAQKQKSLRGHAARWGKEMPGGMPTGMIGASPGACPEVCPDDALPSPSPSPSPFPDQDQLPSATAREKKHPAPPHPETEGAYFSRVDDFFTAMGNGNLDEWGKAYPAIPIEGELQRAKVWLKANPAKQKKNLQRFVVNWLAHAQEKGGVVDGRGTKGRDVEHRTTGLSEKYAGR